MSAYLNDRKTKKYQSECKILIDISLKNYINFFPFYNFNFPVFNNYFYISNHNEYF